MPTRSEPADHTLFWSQPAAALFADLDSSATGLSSATAAERLTAHGANRLGTSTLVRPLSLLLAQFKSPLVLILIFAALVSVATGALVDALIVLVIILASALLSFWQEYHAGNAVEQLRRRIRLQADVLRDGHTVSVPAEEIVPGDVVLLSAGSLIPADGLLLKADDFFVNEAVLTGETFPVEKKPGVVRADSPLPQRTNCVFMGTNVRSGMARMLVVQTGKKTVFGAVAERLNLRPPETEFERGIRRFGAMLTQVMTLLVLLVFAANVFLEKPAVDSLLFAVALAVGLAPELLPAILSLTLSRGAIRMAKHGVIVRRLSSLENFGSMDVLCTDKTGTLTQGVVQLDGALDTAGNPSEKVFLAAWLNAYFQSGLPNPLDEAIVAQAKPDIAAFEKTEEIPYDFIRKRLSIAVKNTERPADRFRLITKGAFANVLDVCTHVHEPDGTTTPLDAARRAALEQLFNGYSAKGFRVLGLAVRDIEPRPEYTVADESDMIFAGFLLFFDPPKDDASEAVADLHRLGVELKIITGDNRQVARHVAEAVGLPTDSVLTGAEIRDIHDDALWQVAGRTTIFAEVDPNQKERIITALQKGGHVVGYLGDGINDAPALHAADVGISVDNAVDVAKETADFVLLEKKLGVLHQGIVQGRSTFANTLKYVFTTTSANFGNMLSMAGLSLMVPFLPLLPKQILLNNFLSDFPAMTIAGDSIDPEFVEKPRRWDVRMIRNFMVAFGLVSSVFDYITFGVLLWWLRVSEPVFQTAWFVESLLTELVILLIVRTRRPFFRSRPGRWLWISTVAVAAAAIALPYLPGAAEVFGFTPLPATLMLVLVGITLAYAVANELLKGYFFRRFGG
jgi:Mg2+-importing ATPase